MKNCIYIIGNEHYTYKELVDMLLANPDIQTVSDIIYSKASKQEAITARIYAIKKEYATKRNSSILDGEPDIEGHMTLSQLIDSPIFSTLDSKLISKMNRDDYVKYRVAQLRENGAKEEDIERLRQIAQNEVDNWDMIGEDFYQFHTLINSFDFQNKGLYEFKQLLRGTKFESASENLYADLHNQYIRMRSDHVGSKMIRNISLEAELKNSIEKVVGHIDYILVDTLGNLHIYNYKASTEDSKGWITVKQEKYKYTLALLKQMLSQYGFNVKNMTLNLMPIKFNYTGDLSRIDSINAEETKEYTMSAGSKYVFSKYDRIAKEIIPSKLGELDVAPEAIIKANRILSVMFPEKGIRAHGIQQTVVEQIRQAVRTGTIKSVNEPNHYYDVVINGKVYPISSPSSPTKNQEILDLFEENMELLQQNESVVAARLTESILNSYNKGYPSFENSKGFAYSAAYLNSVLRQYFEHKVKDKTKFYDWEFIDNDNLLSANILMFRNQEGQVDIIALSPYNLNREVSFKYGSSLAGSYLLDRESQGISKAIYGNIEAMRVITLLNEIIPELEGKCELGTLKVISPVGGGSSKFYSLEKLNKEFGQFLDIAKHNSKDIDDVQNNFRNIKFRDPIDTLLYEYKNIINSDSLSSISKKQIIDLAFMNLESGATREAKKQQLFELMQNIMALKDKQLGNASPKEIYQYSITGTPEIKALANLLIATRNAYAYYSGEDILPEESFSTLRGIMTTWDRHPSRNVRLVSNMVQQTIDKISYDSTVAYSPIRKFIMEYYDKVGYSTAQNSLIGNQESHFRNLFDPDADMVFKNPYTDGTLTPDERVFLKKVLFAFGKIRAEQKGLDFNFTDENDSRLQDFISNKPWYFWVPLEKASVATRRQHGTDQIKEVKNKIRQFFTNPKKIAEEYYEDITTAQDKIERDTDLKYLSLRSKFIVGEGEAATRDEYILKNGKDFFETNVENLLVDFLVDHITVKEMQKTLFRAKALLLGLFITGEETRENYNEISKYIEEFLKLNVFNRSIMEDSSKVMVGLLQPLRSLTSKVMVGANVIGSVRDTFQGIWNLTSRVITHYMTDISAESATKAYKETLQNILTSSRSVSKVSLLNKQFKISFDASIPSEALKTGRSGIFNYQEYFYSTLKRPDFLNRMTLFIARCMQDGCYDALYEEDGELKYDWKQDARFSVFASGDTSHKDYAQQRALYMSKIRQYNEEHPEDQLSYTDDLPMPYSNKEIQAIKNVSNTIYGAYDKTVKAKFENMAVGWIFGQFTTWMNSWINNYFAKPDSYQNGVLEWVQDTDSSGNPLYFDENGELTTEVTPYPAYKQVPVIVQGVWYTIKDSINVLRNGGKAEFLEKIWSDPIQRHNLNKLLSDLLMSLFFFAIYKFAFDPAYKEFQKEMKEHPEKFNPVTYAFVEAIYKGGEQSTDDMLGPASLLSWLGRSQNPAMYSLPITATKDLSQWAFGDKTFGMLMSDYMPFIKNFRDTREVVSDLE